MVLLVMSFYKSRRYAEDSTIAWVMGAADPTSGTVSLHEVIRGFGALLRKGWKPLRTSEFHSRSVMLIIVIVIVINVSFQWSSQVGTRKRLDCYLSKGEALLTCFRSQYGLVGSTEWGEDFSTWISDHVVTYLNVDVSVAGSRWEVGATPSLAHIIKQTALDVPHPTIAGKTLWDAREDSGPFTDVYLNQTIDAEYLARYNEDRKKSQASKTSVVPLGSGSDYTVFLQRLGVPSMDQGFAHTPTDAPYHYHSVYDSQAWQERYADPGFTRHVSQPIIS